MFSFKIEVEFCYKMVCKKMQMIKNALAFNGQAIFSTATLDTIAYASESL